MEGIIWLFLALLVALVALGVVLVGLRGRPPPMEHNPNRCKSCETPISLRRVSTLRSHLLLGERICPHCGKRIKRWRGEEAAR